MAALAFTDQRERLRRIVQNALAGATYESSHPEPERMLVLEATRPDGRRVTVRFRGVSDSEATETPSPGSNIRIGQIGPAEKFSLLRLLFPFGRARGSGAARVRIEAGTARLDIVCEDAEWWEDEGEPRGTSV